MCDDAPVPSWDDVRYFLAAAERRSLKGAGRELGVEHTTVARRITALEEQLGVSLFVRLPSGLELTAEGEALHATALEMQDAARALDRRAEELRAPGVDGRVRVTTSEAGAGFLVRRLGELRARHPKLEVDVLSDNRTYDLLRGEADVALRGAETTSPDLISRRLVDCAWCGYVARGYLQSNLAPASLEVLDGVDVVGFERSFRFIPGADLLEPKSSSSARVRIRANSILTALNGILGGLGVGVLPCYLGDEEPTLVRVGEPIAHRPIALVFRADVGRLPRVRAVVDFFTEVFERERDLFEGRRLRP